MRSEHLVSTPFACRDRLTSRLGDCDGPQSNRLHCRAYGSLHASHRYYCVRRNWFLFLHFAKTNPPSTFSHPVAARDIPVIILHSLYLFNVRPTFRVASLRLPTFVAIEPASLYIYLSSFWISVIRHFEYCPVGLDVSMSFLCSSHTQFVEERLFCASCKKQRAKKHFSKMRNG